MKVYVLGAGGHAKVVIAALEASGREADSVWDDNADRWGEKLLGVPIRGPIESLREQPRLPAVIAIGANQARQKLAASLDLEWTQVVHPAAWVHRSVQVGPGTVIFAGAIVQPDTTLGAHVIVNTGATIDHDCRVGDFAHIAPGNAIAGVTTVGEGVLMGAGGATIPCSTIGDWAIVGAGATVILPIPPAVTAVGTPARPLPISSYSSPPKPSSSFSSTSSSKENP